jgi:hypothetical protein
MTKSILLEAVKKHVPNVVIEVGSIPMCSAPEFNKNFIHIKHLNGSIFIHITSFVEDGFFYTFSYASSYATFAANDMLDAFVEMFVSIEFIDRHFKKLTNEVINAGYLPFTPDMYGVDIKVSDIKAVIQDYPCVVTADRSDYFEYQLGSIRFGYSDGTMYFNGFETHIRLHLLHIVDMPDLLFPDSAIREAKLNQMI